MFPDGRAPMSTEQTANQETDTLRRALEQVAERVPELKDGYVPVITVAEDGFVRAHLRQSPELQQEPLAAQLSRRQLCLSANDLTDVVSKMRQLAANQASVSYLIKAAAACGLVEKDENWGRKEVERQWAYLISAPGLPHLQRSPYSVLTALMALVELTAKPDVIFFDDLPYLAMEGQHPRALKAWRGSITAYKSIFSVHYPPLPVRKDECAREPQYLYPFVEYEFQRLARPLAAVVDIHWLWSDKAGGDGQQGLENEYLGLELIRMIRAIKPNLPIFIWSNIGDQRTLQSAMQLGATYYFNKEEQLAFAHQVLSKGDKKEENYLNPGKLWFHIWEWEQNRYTPGSRAPVLGQFVVAERPDYRTDHKKFREMFGLTRADLAGGSRHPVIRILESLLPEAASIEIVKVFGGGRSSGSDPFLVEGRTSQKQVLKPVQLKISKDWRALARERKGFRDVIYPILGPGAAQVITGPYRLGDWCGMVQSFAAPEEAYEAPASRGTLSLKDFLRENLDKPDRCEAAVDAVFRGILQPLYGRRTMKNRFSCHRAFLEVSPSHLECEFHPPSHHAEIKPWDFTPEELSRKNENARCEAAGRRWRQFLPADKTVIIKGLIVDTLEYDSADPLHSRLRLYDPMLGIKVDLRPGNLQTAERWRVLQESPVKLRDLPITFALSNPKTVPIGDNQRIDLAWNWRSMLDEKMAQFGIAPARSLLALGEEGWGRGRDEDEAPEAKDPAAEPQWLPAVDYLMTFHPVDLAEDFHVGPVHGDLNLGNILLHQRNGTILPWLIDFDKTQYGLPIVFDLVKLEVEAYHQVGYELFLELCTSCGLPHGDQTEDAEYCLPQFVNDFERALENPETKGVDHLWTRFSDDRSSQNLVRPSTSLQRRFAGFFRYLRAVRRNIDELEVGQREYLISRVIYCLSCLKFKNLYSASDCDAAPFPAQLMLYKLQVSILLLDECNGIERRPQSGEGARTGGASEAQDAPPPESEQEIALAAAISPWQDYKIISDLVRLVRRERRHALSGKPPRPFGELVADPKLEIDTRAMGQAGREIQNDLACDLATFDQARDELRQRLQPEIRKYEQVFSVLRNGSIRGERAWFREILWYIRDYGIGASEQIAEFTLGMVFASLDPSILKDVLGRKSRDADPDYSADLPTLSPNRRDFASTGRVSNTYPINKMLQHMETSPGQIVKMSSRGESGGTIDILEQAGVRICQSLAAIRDELNLHNFAVAEPGERLCVLDKIMMELRKSCGCMKVGDLVIASISAKKIAAGIGTFDVQVVTGYDAKFESLIEPGADTSARLEKICATWKEVWKTVCGYFGATGQVMVEEPFLSEEFEKEMNPVILGTALLAARIFAKHPKALGQFPAGVRRRVEELNEAVEQLGTGLYSLVSASVDFLGGEGSGETRKCERIVKECPLQEATWFLVKDLQYLSNKLKCFDGLSAICIEGKKLTPDAISVEYFDCLYGRLAKSRHSLASVLYWPSGPKSNGEACLCILVPQEELPDNVDLFCWKLFRDGFRWPATEELSNEKERHRVIRIGP